MDGYLAAETKTVTIETGETLAYREVGKDDSIPLVLLQHFRGSLDSWDPALIDGLATNRRVIAFDNVGVAASSGLTPATVAAMATRRGFLRIRAGPGQLRPARLLHRQLHRPGNAAHGSRPRQVRRAGQLGTRRRRRHARLG